MSINNANSILPNFTNIIDQDYTLAPDIVFQQSNGQFKHLKDFRGKVILLSFWASWCEPCLMEFGSFRSLVKMVHNQDFIIIPINIEENMTVEAINKIWSKYDLPFPTYIDPTMKAAQIMGIEGLPSNFILNRNGMLIVSSQGTNDWSSQQELNLFNALLQEPFLKNNLQNEQALPL